MQAQIDLSVVYPSNLASVHLGIELVHSFQNDRSLSHTRSPTACKMALLSNPIALQLVTWKTGPQ